MSFHRRRDPYAPSSGGDVAQGKGVAPGKRTRSSQLPPGRGDQQSGAGKEDRQSFAPSGRAPSWPLGGFMPTDGGAKADGPTASSGTEATGGSGNAGAPAATAAGGDAANTANTGNAANASAAGAPISGTVPDIVTPPGGGKATGDHAGLHLPEAGTPGADGAGAAKVVLNLGLDFSQPSGAPLHGDAGKQDSVSSAVGTVTFSQPGGRAVAPFGEEFYEPTFEGVSYALAGGVCTINATLHAKCPYGTNGGGNTDVPSGAAPVVTAGTWKAIAADLTPGSKSPHKSPRNAYYSQALVDRHERFHGTDDLGWTRGAGLGLVKTKLESGTVNGPTAAADVTALLDSARQLLISENFTWYKGGGTSHDTYAGEIRAYADGRPHYQRLADDIERQGRNLEASAEAAAAAGPAGPAGPHAALSTSALISQIGSASAADRPALEAELRKRNMLVYVKVKSTEDWLGADEVYVKASAGGRSVTSSQVSLNDGQSHGYPLSLGPLVPIAGPIEIRVVDGDWPDGDDVIVHLAWGAPYSEGRNTRSYDGANYEVWVKMEK
jgi:hypothetical protein